jgi:hypothetical protein
MGGIRVRGRSVLRWASGGTGFPTRPTEGEEDGLENPSYRHSSPGRFRCCRKAQPGQNSAHPCREISQSLNRLLGASTRGMMSGRRKSCRRRNLGETGEKVKKTAALAHCLLSLTNERWLRVPSFTPQHTITFTPPTWHGEGRLRVSARIPRACTSFWLFLPQQPSDGYSCNSKIFTNREKIFRETPWHGRGRGNRDQVRVLDPCVNLAQGSTPGVPVSHRQRIREPSTLSCFGPLWKRVSG